MLCALHLAAWCSGLELISLRRGWTTFERAHAIREHCDGSAQHHRQRAFTDVIDHKSAWNWRVAYVPPHRRQLLGQAEASSQRSPLQFPACSNLPNAETLGTKLGHFCHDRRSALDDAEPDSFRIDHSRSCPRDRPGNPAGIEHVLLLTPPELTSVQTLPRRSVL